jgi:type 1 glutamine amidotransferase
MSIINYQAERQILVMTKGHPFSRDDFLPLFDEIPGIAATAIEQPACQAFFEPSLAEQYDAFVCYDMPGLDFQSADEKDGLAPRYIEPSDKFKKNFLALLEQGHGFVFLHHSIAGWPAWQTYADIVGGKFLYKPGDVRGQSFVDSGYRHDIEHQITVECDHPVTEGVSASFNITDELYLSHVFADEVIPLLSSHYDYTEGNFYSAQKAVSGEMFSREGWTHAPGHNLIGWAKSYGNSPIVYLQCGDSRPAYQNKNFQRLLTNAIQWVASDEAKVWARSR